MGPPAKTSEKIDKRNGWDGEGRRDFCAFIVYMLSKPCPGSPQSERSDGQIQKQKRESPTHISQLVITEVINISHDPFSEPKTDMK